VKILITGIYGFAGAHLANYLASQGNQVAGFCLETDIDNGAIPDSARIFKGDLRQKDRVSEVISDFNPDRVVHLAAVSSVKFSFDNPAETFAINITGSQNLLEAIAHQKKPAQTLLVSSSEIYGQLGPNDVPVSETALLAPVNPYGVSKAAVDLMGYQYFKSYGVPVHRIRAFSHTGPRQSTQAVISDWAKQVATIELGLVPAEIKVGNLKVIRDYTDVEDIVRAYEAIFEKGRPGEAYNVCSGIGHQLDILLEQLIGFSARKITVKIDPSRFRPVDIPILIGSPQKIKSETGWEPRIDIHSTLKKVYDYWHKTLSNNVY
jgi:GDP-4-dehydro-6-deoxy-D-mannose reductase